MRVLLLVILLSGCTTVSTDDPSWAYPKENLQ
jgi:uncharacterized protein YceK